MAHSALQKTTQRFYKSYFPLLACCATPWVLNAAVQLSSLFLRRGFLYATLYVVCSLGLFPLYHMELSVIFYRFVIGEPPPLHPTGRFYRIPTLFTALFIALISMSGVIASHFLLWSTALFPLRIGLPTSMAFLAVTIWLTFRLGLAAILFDGNNTKSAQEVLLASWTVTNGKFGGYLKWCTTRLWWLFLVSGLGTGVAAHFTKWSPLLFVQLFELFLMPCVFYVTSDYYNVILRIYRELAVRKTCK